MRTDNLLALEILQVSSLFPQQFRDQLMEQANAEQAAKAGKSRDSFTFNNAKSSLKTFMTGAPELVDDDELFLTKPVADLFPEGKRQRPREFLGVTFFLTRFEFWPPRFNLATVMFADIVGFSKSFHDVLVLGSSELLTCCICYDTACWASIREPSQVFTLLESIYRSFDKIAKRRQVYKVEVVGDCYVAVAGKIFSIAYQRHKNTFSQLFDALIKRKEFLFRCPTMLWLWLDLLAIALCGSR